MLDGGGVGRDKHATLDRAVGNDGIKASVVVEVRQDVPEPGEGHAGHAQPTGVRGVFENARCVGSVQRVGLAAQVRDKEVSETVAVHVAQCDAHAGFGAAVAVEGAAGQHGGLPERAVAVVDPEEVPRHVVGDVHVLPAVAVQVCTQDTQAGPGHVCDAAVRRHVAEPAVTQVAIEFVRGRRHPLRSAVIRATGEVVAVGRTGVEDVVGDVEVEPSVAVVVEETRRHRPHLVVDAGRFGDVGERGVTVVAPEPIALEIGQVEIQVAVVVVIADDAAHAVACGGQTGLPGPVGEHAVRRLQVEPVAGRALPVDEIDVESAVAVEIRQCTAGAHDFLEAILPLEARIVCEPQPDSVSDLNEP